MDTARAHKWFAELVDKEVGQWQLRTLLGHGKSAIVTHGIASDGSEAAIKIFEPELVDRFGLGVQLKRIEREISLIGHDVPNLVKILGGGQAGDLLYVAMELLPPTQWRPLSDRLMDASRDHIWPLMSALAKAVQGLEALGLVHRDIKPENIMVSEDFAHVKLMDLGVMKRIGAESITDEVSRPFIGTLRYSSPEFLLREEKDTPEGWRALSFYQLGGVLHDLIMRKPLFADFSDPFARLAKAVQEHYPTIEAPDVHADLVLLCRNCLVKDPTKRLQCVAWSNFDVPVDGSVTPADAARERVKRRLLLTDQPAKTQRKRDDEARRLRDQVRSSISESVVTTVRETMTADEFPVFSLGKPTNKEDSCSFVLRFGPSQDHAVPEPVEISFDVTILDAAERICRVVSRNTTQVIVSGFKDPVELFVGVFEHASVRIAVRDWLYLMMDGIQDNKI